MRAEPASSRAPIVLQLLAQGIDAHRGLVFEAVQLLSQVAFELGSHSLELIHQRRYLALFAQQSYAELLDLSGRSGSE